MEASRSRKVYLGRRKIPIVKISDKRSLMVAFSKRRKGLFKKANEVAVLCGAEVSALAFSPAGKPFTFGDVRTLLDRLLGENVEEEQKWFWDVAVDKLDLDELKLLEEYLVTLSDSLDSAKNIA